ncbi:hypothetical protein GCM10023322_11400 [Rugosimonospora acidiphila]|uniref:DUF3592 domain-containing protein n=1 Tax=Rugosimonospora acidiphila TaxID=556531 RepID=A0ABP9RL88_9ACTN
MRPPASRVRSICAVVFITIALVLLWGAVAIAGHQRAAEQQRRATQRSIGQVTQVYAGKPEPVEVTWLDRDETSHVAVFHAVSGQRIALGDPFTVRYDPQHPQRAYALTTESRTTRFDILLLVVLAGTVVLLCWLVRLSRWWWGARRGEVGFAVAHIQPTPAWRRKAGRIWVRLTDEQGLVRYQQVLWEPWLADFPRGGRVAIRRCPPPGESYIIEVPSRGRLWPAGATDDEAPSAEAHARLVRDPATTVLFYVALVMIILLWTFVLASLFIPVYFLLLAFAAWHWFAFAPPGLVFEKAR